MRPSRNIWMAAVLSAAVLTGAAFWVLRTPPAIVREQTETARRLEEIRENF